MTTLERILKIPTSKGAGYFILIDPDKWEQDQILDLAQCASEGGVDGLLVGSSLLLSSTFDNLVGLIRRHVDIPIMIFPGSPTQVSRHADAIFFLSLISGRNATYLIGDQVRAAPVIRALGVEAISVGYMLIESGSTTSAEFISDTRPIPRDKIDIAKATALAAEYLGMHLVYLEGGSGAKKSVPDAMISAVHEYVSLPLIVGGGIRTPEQAEKKVRSGASFVVTGNILEQDSYRTLITEFAEAVHQ